ncbi:MAG: hypothetical protein Q9163_006544 [Psora crenata]
MLTAPLPFAVGMKLGVLVDGDSFPAMFVAKDIPTDPAMMPALEETKGFGAGGITTNGRVGVGFPMGAGRGPRHSGEIGGVFLRGSEVLWRDVVEEGGFVNGSDGGGDGGAA